MQLPVADYYRLTNDCRRRASETQKERGPKQVCATDCCAVFPFHGCRNVEIEDNAPAS